MHLTNTSKNWKQLAFNILLSHNTLTGEGPFHNIMKMFNPNIKVQHRQSRGQKLCYISLFLCHLWNIFEPFSGTKHLSTWSEQSQDGLRRGRCKRDLLCWTENYIQHQNSTYICSFHCCFDIPWNLKDPLFNYSDQDTGQGSLCAVKRIWGYII